MLGAGREAQRGPQQPFAVDDRRLEERHAYRTCPSLRDRRIIRRCRLTLVALGVIRLADSLFVP